MGPVARFVGQGCGNFLLRELKFRRHVCSLENFSSWVWIAFLSEKAIQTSSGTYLISFPSSDSSDYCIENSSSGPSMSWLCWHNPAIWGSEQEDLTSFTLLTKCPFFRKCDLKRIFLVQYCANLHMERQQCSPGMWFNASLSMWGGWRGLGCLSCPLSRTLPVASTHKNSCKFLAPNGFGTSAWDTMSVLSVLCWPPHCCGCLKCCSKKEDSQTATDKCLVLSEIARHS